jgi:hypothetical protein
MLYSMRGDETALLNLNDDSFKFNHLDLVTSKDIITFHLARSYFNLKEYIRASNCLLNVIGISDNANTGPHSATITVINPNDTTISSNSSSSTSIGCYFLYIYSKYMSIMKKCVDNKADLFSKLLLFYLFHD